MVRAWRVCGVLILHIQSCMLSSVAAVAIFCWASGFGSVAPLRMISLPPDSRQAILLSVVLHVLTMFPLQQMLLQKPQQFW